MGREHNLLLRRTSPLAAVLVLLAPAAGHAASFSPDPPPGAAGLRPDPAPSARPEPKPEPSLRAPVLHAPARAVVTRQVPVRAVTTPTETRAAPPPRRPRRPAAQARPHAARPAIAKLELPPVVVPAFIPATLRRRPPAGLAALAALALALAALTAGSGAGLVRTWSRR
jgi:hypothetical protein